MRIYLGRNMESYHTSEKKYFDAQLRDFDSITDCASYKSESDPYKFTLKIFTASSGNSKVTKTTYAHIFSSRIKLDEACHKSS